jgi:hypothetical protein
VLTLGENLVGAELLSHKLLIERVGLPVRDHSLPTWTHGDGKGPQVFYDERERYRRGPHLRLEVPWSHHCKSVRGGMFKQPTDPEKLPMITACFPSDFLQSIVTCTVFATRHQADDEETTRHSPEAPEVSAADAPGFPPWMPALGFPPAGSEVIAAGYRGIQISYQGVD